MAKNRKCKAAPDSRVTCVYFVVQQKYLKRLLIKAARTSRRHAKQAQTRLDRLSFMLPEQLQTLRALAKDTDELYATVSTLSAHPHLTNADAHTSGLEPGKRQWEVGKAGYLNWASAQLVQQGQRGSGGPVAVDGLMKEEMAAAVREIGDEE